MSEEIEYTYTNGSFTEGIGLEDWEDLDDLASWLKKNNFDHHVKDSIGEAVQIYNHKSEQEYIAFWSHDAETSILVYIVGAPSLMMFYRDFITPLFLSELYYEIADSDAPENLRQDVEDIAEYVSKKGMIFSTSSRKKRKKRNKG